MRAIWYYLHCSICAAGLALPAIAQRVDENATTQAGDAFGFSLGGESVGIYNSGEVRGLSPTAAGNVRIDGLYFDQQSDISDKLINSTAIRVGLSALDFDLPAPSGIVDQGLRIATKNVITTTIGLGDFLSPYIDIEGGWVSKNKRWAVTYGAGLSRDKLETGATSRGANAALLVHGKLSEAVDVTVFGNRSWYYDDQDRISIYTAGNFLPPQFPRGVAYNQPWGEGTGNESNIGTIIHAGLGGGWDFKLGAFWSQYDPALNFEELYRDTQADGSATDVMSIVNPGNISRSLSGEARMTKLISDGARSHSLSASVRGRINNQRSGGDFEYPIGTRRLGILEIAPQPTPVFTDQRRDDVQQVAGALSYRLSWKGVGILNLGVQKVHFEKTVDEPEAELGVQTGTSTPLLYNASFAVELGSHVILFGGYTKGLEESGTAPRSALNADQVLPVVITTQRDIGLRWAVTKDTTIIAGLFDIRKPFADTNAADIFEFVGQRRNRGLEVSMNSQPVKGLSLVLGALFIDHKISGPKVVGDKPVGTIGRNIQASVNYDIAAVPGLSAGGYVTHYGNWIASRDNVLLVPSRTVLDLNIRYRFDRWGARHRIRMGIGNVFNTYGWRVSGDGGFQYNGKRRFSLTLTSDW
jgi:iron complex outermembrane recepter protein